ncbi:MAG: hypothetical protein HKN48_05645, partial [Flavobacteriaceae bacterium]|nr:hypothetical protein [Flavobacteriaceae bacterium]
MKGKVFTIIFLLFASLVFSQSEAVVISEKKTGKRVVIFAENKSADTLNVFLMVHAKGYRRSADKPVLKDIPPKSSVPMITLIELSNVESNYTYELIINDKKKIYEFSYDREVVDIENVLRDRIVMFTLSECEKCDALSTELETRRINHRVFNIEKDPALYKQFMKFIEKELTSEVRIQFPVIWNK